MRFWQRWTRDCNCRATHPFTLGLLALSVGLQAASFISIPFRPTPQWTPHTFDGKIKKIEGRKVRNTKFKRPDFFAISLSIAIALTSVSPVLAQQLQTLSSCAIHFKARADWMRALDGKPETIALMESYAGIVEGYAYAAWLSTPRDWRMRTGVLPNSDRPQFRKRLYRDAVLDELTKWALADQNGSPRPLCIQDAICIQCTTLLRNAVNTHN